MTMWEVLSFADKPYKGLSKAKVNLVTLQKFVSNIFMEGERETKDKQLYDGFAPLSCLFLFLPFSLSLLLFLKILGTSDTCRIPSLIIWLINLYHLFILTSLQFRIALVTFDDFWKSWKQFIVLKIYQDGKWYLL